MVGPAPSGIGPVRGCGEWHRHSIKPPAKSVQQALQQEAQFPHLAVVVDIGLGAQFHNQSSVVVDLA
jgi:hypothetical protein